MNVAWYKWIHTYLRFNRNLVSNNYNLPEFIFLFLCTACLHMVVPHHMLLNTISNLVYTYF